MTLRAIVASLALVLVGGCVLAPKFEEPKLDVVDVQMLRGDLLRQQLRVRMRVQNPNDRELPVRSIEYQVQVAGEAFAHGESERNFIVPANGETEFDVSVTANAAAARAAPAGQRPQARYRRVSDDRQGVAGQGMRAQHSLRQRRAVQAALISCSYSAT